MRTRDFFRLVIKIFSIFIILQLVLSYIPTSIVTLLIDYHDFSLLAMLGFLGLFIIIYGIFLLIIKKIDLIIDFLRLDQGFDEDKISLGHWDEQKIFSLAVVLIGGLLIVLYFPSFLSNIWEYFKYNAAPHLEPDLFMFNLDRKVQYFDWAISCINIIFGYLMIINHTLISGWFAQKAKSKNIESD